MEPENLKLNLPLDEVIKMKEKSSKSSKPEVPTEKFKKVFVGNLNFSTNWQKLKDYMKKAGNVLFADVFLDQKGRSKGCGLVEFSEHEEAVKAIKTLNDTRLDGRYIYIREDNLSFVKTSKDYEDKKRSRDRSRSNSRKKHKDHKERKKDHKKTSKSSKKIHKSKSKSKSNSIKSKSRSKSKTKSPLKSRSKSEHNEKIEIDNEINNNNNINNNSNDLKQEDPIQNVDDKLPKRKPSLSQDEKDKGYQIEVKNLPWNVSWQNLKDAFADFGAILTADIESDKTEKSKGIGYVVFERKKDAMKAIENMHRAIFNGKEISVKMTKR